MIAGDGVGWWFCLLFGAWGWFLYCISFRVAVPFGWVLVVVLFSVGFCIVVV